MPDRQLDDARRLERQLIALRWVVAAFGTVQVWFALRDRGPDSHLALPLGSALVVGLVVGNLLIARAARGASTVRRMRSLGWVAYALDATVVLGLVWISSNGRGDPVWVVAYLLPLEAAARWGIAGAVLGATLFLGGEVLRELDVAARHPLLRAGWPTIGFRAGMAYVVAAVVGVFASSLRREAALADKRASEAQAIAARAEESARREREARSEVAAFHAAVLAAPESERLPQTLRATAGVTPSASSFANRASSARRLSSWSPPTETPGTWRASDCSRRPIRSPRRRWRARPCSPAATPWRR